jgi:hypothetical protein
VTDSVFCLSFQDKWVDPSLYIGDIGIIKDEQLIFVPLEEALIRIDRERKILIPPCCAEIKHIFAFLENIRFRLVPGEIWVGSEEIAEIEKFYSFVRRKDCLVFKVSEEGSVPLSPVKQGAPKSPRPNLLGQAPPAESKDFTSSQRWSKRRTAPAQEENPVPLVGPMEMNEHQLDSTPGTRSNSTPAIKRVQTVGAEPTLASRAEGVKQWSPRRKLAGQVPAAQPEDSASPQRPSKRRTTPG